jgi:hypothetical protein
MRDHTTMVGMGRTSRVNVSIFMPLDFMVSVKMVLRIIASVRLIASLHFAQNKKNSSCHLDMMVIADISLSKNPNPG